MLSKRSGWFARAVSSVLGLTSGLIISTVAITGGHRVLAAGLPTTAGSAFVMVSDAISSPSGNFVKGAVRILGFATPDLDVAGIQFRINGQNVGGEVTSGVCGINWDTTGGPDGPYVVTAIVRDTSSNFVTSVPFSVTVENAALQISGVTTNVPSGSSISISWTTNQQATSQIYFDTGGGSLYGSSTGADSTLTTAHSQTLSGLSPGTTYHFRVESRNAAGGTAASGDLTFTTSSATPSAPTGPSAPSTPAVTVSAPLMSLDKPISSTTVTLPFDIGGWAIDRNSSNGTGVDGVQVWAFPTDGSAGIFVGTATYGGARGDVAGVYGPGFTNSGFSLRVRQLPRGTYQLTASAHNSQLGVFNDSRTATVTVEDPTQIHIDSPSNGGTVGSTFRVSGWAIDIRADAGTGIDAVHVWAFPMRGGDPTFLGVASIGGARPDIAALFGSQFTNAGFDLTGTLPDGWYLIAAYGHKASTGQFDLADLKQITVNSPAP
jgi:hypothetical protein